MAGVAGGTTLRATPSALSPCSITALPPVLPLLRPTRSQIEATVITIEYTSMKVLLHMQNSQPLLDRNSRQPTSSKTPQQVSDPPYQTGLP